MAYDSAALDQLSYTAVYRSCIKFQPALSIGCSQRRIPDSPMFPDMFPISCVMRYSCRNRACTTGEYRLVAGGAVPMQCSDLLHRCLLIRFSACVLRTRGYLPDPTLALGPTGAFRPLSFRRVSSHSRCFFVSDNTRSFCSSESLMNGLYGSGDFPEGSWCGVSGLCGVSVFFSMAILLFHRSADRDV